MRKIFALLLTALGLNTACSQNFENMDVQQFSELIADTNVVILDVRKAEEFAEGHIKGAILIDQFKSDFMEQAKAKLPMGLMGQKFALGIRNEAAFVDPVSSRRGGSYFPFH